MPARKPRARKMKPRKRRVIDPRSPWCRLVIPHGESKNPKVLRPLRQLLRALGFGGRR